MPKTLLNLPREIVLHIVTLLEPLSVQHLLICRVLRDLMLSGPFYRHISFRSPAAVTAFEEHCRIAGQINIQSLDFGAQDDSLHDGEWDEDRVGVWCAKNRVLRTGLEAGCDLLLRQLSSLKALYWMPVLSSRKDDILSALHHQPQHLRHLSFLSTRYCSQVPARCQSLFYSPSLEDWFTLLQIPTLTHAYISSSGPLPIVYQPGSITSPLSHLEFWPTDLGHAELPRFLSCLTHPLRSFTLQSAEEHHLPTLSDALKKYCKEVVNLSIADFGGGDRIGHNIDIDYPSHMPNLRVLHIDGDYLSRETLCCFSATPCLEAISLHNVLYHNPQPLLDTIPSWSSSIRYLRLTHLSTMSFENKQALKVSDIS